MVSQTRVWCVLVVGAGGMLGGEVVDALAEADRTVEGHDLPDVDLTDPASCRRVVAGQDVVVNCAAYTAVDAAEQDEGRAFAVNATGVANLARACADAGAVLVHVSTDYVFSGDATVPYAEDDVPAPRTAYGRTKAAGEWALRTYLPDRHYLLRTAWLYGREGPSFVHTMRRLALEGDGPLTVVDDQIGQPTWTRDVAHLLVTLLDRSAPFGTYHATSRGQTTWFGLARAVFEAVGADGARVRPVSSDAYPRPAPRPTWSVLGHDALRLLGVEPIGDWQQRLGVFLGSEERAT